jgi:hypothetical protein
MKKFECGSFSPKVENNSGEWEIRSECEALRLIWEVCLCWITKKEKTWLKMLEKVDFFLIKSMISLIFKNHSLNGLPFNLIFIRRFLKNSNKF